MLSPIQVFLFHPDLRCPEGMLRSGCGIGSGDRHGAPGGWCRVLSLACPQEVAVQRAIGDISV